MKFATSLKSLVMLAATSLLVACGGGGGSDSNSGFTPAGLSLTTSTSNVSMNTRSLTTITVTLRQANGTAVSDGATITATVNGAGLGNLSAGNGANGGTATAPTVGGVANFYFQSGGTPGAGSITFSAADPSTTTRTVSRTVNVNVAAGPGNDPRISFEPSRTEIPVNTDGVPIFIGSPYIAEVLVNIRSATGQPINDDGDGDQAVQFAITPVELGAVSVLDDPDTDDVNEFSTPWGSIFTGVAAGTARAFVWSGPDAGTITLRAAFTDPDTGQRVEGIYEFNLVTNIPPLPAEVEIVGPNAPIYTSDSGGNSSGSFTVLVSDGGGTAVPDPVQGSAAFNNVRLEIVPNGGAGDAVLAGTDASGQQQEGTVISVRTTTGVANALVRAGVSPGSYTLRATVDRADNNVDNGITSPITTERTIVISDGRAFDIEITQPRVDALQINPVDPNVEDGEQTGNPDGTYSLTVAAIVTDRLGNPVLPGTQVRFGLIDEPQATGLGDFLISGNDGDPQESGTTFTALSGDFTTAGSGVGPGDTLVIFGENVPGNRDHESARTVQTVNSDTSLTVTRRFNANDDTGVSVDSQGILPYVIGRAADGNISTTGVTNEFGVVRTTMNYPVSQLGKRVIVWAETDGDIVNGTPETVTDVEPLVFAGVAPLQLSASPASIPGNTTQQVLVCATDARFSPIRGVTIGFAFEDLDGSGFVDDVPSSGVLDDVTGADGCTVATVRTTGVLGEGEPQVVFFAGGAEAPVDIVVGEFILQASPTVTSSTSTLVTLTLLNGNGVPQPGFQLQGTCTGTNGTIVGLSDGPGVTDANGRTTVRITANNLNQVNQAGGGLCTFTTADESASATVTLVGQDVCLTEFSPPPNGCEPDEPVETFTLTVNLDAALPGGTAGFSVQSNPAGITCAVGTGEVQICTAEFTEGTVVSLTTSVAAPGVNWTGECIPFGGSNPSTQATVNMSGERVCTAERP